MTSTEALTASLRDRDTPAAGFEPWAAAVVTVLIVVLHVRFLGHAGPLWRDEATSAALSDLPTVGDYFREQPNDSFPLAGPALLRVWERVGPGSADPALRVLGFGVGLAVVAFLWRNARAFGARSPLASLVLLGLSPTAICFGDSVRAYGAGMLAGLVSTAAIFGLTQSAGRRRTAVAAIAALAASLVSVHMLFQNATWLLAVCVAAAAVCLGHGRRRRAVAVLGIGAACAASLLIYLPMVRGRAEFAPMLVFPTTAARVWAVLSQTLADVPLGGRGGRETVWVCVVLVAVLLAAARARLGRPSDAPADDRRTRDAAAFCLVTLTVGIPACFGFMIALRYAMQPFYFLPLMAMTAACVDGLLARASQGPARVFLAAALCLVAAATVPAAWRVAGMRMSNMDEAAAAVARSARPGDVVLVTPYWLSSPFVRYYHGPADVRTVPPVPQLRFQENLPFFRQLHDPHAIDPVLSRVDLAARTGHRVWVVQMSWEPLNWDPDAPVRPPPSTEWNDAPFYRYWNLQVSRALRRAFGVTAGTAVPFDRGGPVNPFEEVQVLRLGPPADDRPRAAGAGTGGGFRVHGAAAGPRRRGDHH